MLPEEILAVLQVAVLTFERIKSRFKVHNNSFIMNTVFLKSTFGGIEIGDLKSVRVNCNVGANTLEQIGYERERLKVIKDSKLLPDTFMDLSIGHYDEPLYKYIIREFCCPVGLVPAYTFPATLRITKEYALDTLKRLADEGLSFFTLHLTAKKDLLEIAKRMRKIPVTSRGGAIVLKQTLDSDNDNIWVSILTQIVDLAKEYGIVISLGSTFRPAGIEEACDEVHLQETEEQLKYCKLLQKEGVQVMVENVGHIALNRLEEHCKRLRQFDAPIMPLGPLPTDCAEDEDHVAAAIGASMMGYWNCAHIINCVTRSEHTKPFFTIEETLEAIRTAKLAAHIIDVARGINSEKDTEMLNMRAENRSCIIEDGRECHRCSMYCPLKTFESDGSKN